MGGACVWMGGACVCAADPLRQGFLFFPNNPSQAAAATGKRCCPHPCYLAPLHSAVPPLMGGHACSLGCNGLRGGSQDSSLLIRPLLCLAPAGGLILQGHQHGPGSLLAL